MILFYAFYPFMRSLNFEESRGDLRPRKFYIDRLHIISLKEIISPKLYEISLNMSSYFLNYKKYCYTKLIPSSKAILKLTSQRLFK